MTEIEAANIALAALDIGHQITTLDDGSTHSSNIRLYMPRAVNDVLVAFDWSRARKRAVLPALSDGPAFGGGTAFPVPPDCVRITAIEGDPSYVLERVGSNMAIVATCGAPLHLFYTSRITVDQMPEEMALAVAMRLAYYIAGPSAGKSDRAGLVLSRYEEALGKARAAENHERSARYQKSQGVGIATMPRGARY